MIACAIEEMLSPFKGIEALIGFYRRQRDFGLCHAPFIGGPCLTHHLLHCLPACLGAPKRVCYGLKCHLNAMRHRLLRRDRGGLLTSLLLALLLLRAYIPIGFMPASGSPFLLEFCPAAASIADAGTPSSHRYPSTLRELPLRQRPRRRPHIATPGLRRAGARLPGNCRFPLHRSSAPLGCRSPIDPAVRPLSSELNYLG